MEQMKQRECGTASYPVSFCECWEIAKSPWRRFRGLMFGAQRGDVLVFPRCNDVHTFGMRRAIDLAFLDECGTVLEACRNVPPNRRIRYRAASSVVERNADPSARWLEQGDVVRL